MRIKGIQTFIVDGQWWNWVFVKVTTDSGLHGWGEAPLAWKEHTAATAIKELGAVLIGEDPRHIEANLQLLHRGEYGGTGPVYNTAISALEQACWDIKGKDAGLPVHALLGGPCRDQVRVYANGWVRGCEHTGRIRYCRHGGGGAGLHSLEVGPIHLLDYGLRTGD